MLQIDGIKQSRKAIRYTVPQETVPVSPKIPYKKNTPKKESAKHRFVSVCERAFFFLDKYVYTPNRNPLI